MAFSLKEDARISNGGGTLDVTVINDDSTESTYSVSLSQIQASSSVNVPDAITSILKEVRNLGE